MFARYAADHLFSDIDELGTRDGSNLIVDGYDFAPSFSIWTTIEECLNPPVIWEVDGAGSSPNRSASRRFSTSPRIGSSSASTSSTRSAADAAVGQCKRATFKYGLGEEFIGVLKTLHKLGPDRPHKVKSGRSRWAPRRRRGVPAQPAEIGPK